VIRQKYALMADCSLCTHLMTLTEKEARLFGVDIEIPDTHINEQNGILHCIKCGNPYTYDYVTYAHLGGFRCNRCGYKRNKPDVGGRFHIEYGYNRQ